MKRTVIIIAVAFALFRILMPWIPLGDLGVVLFKDAAHIFIGGIAGSWLASRDAWKWYLFWGLNLVEVACASASAFI